MKRWNLMNPLVYSVGLVIILSGCATHLSEEKLAAFRTIETIRIVAVQYHYDSAEKTYRRQETNVLPFFEVTARKLLQRADRSPLSADARNYDATLKIEVTCVPESRVETKYIPMDPEFQSYQSRIVWTFGARVSGKISLETPDGTSYRKNYDGYRSPPAVTTGEAARAKGTRLNQETLKDMRTQAFYEATFAVKNCFWLAVSEFMVEVFGMRPVPIHGYKEICPDPLHHYEPSLEQ
jgi:hypothetical protein